MKITTPFQVPIPAANTSINTTHYRAIPFDPKDRRSDEELVRIEEYGVAAKPYYHLQSGNPPYNTRIAGSLPEVWCRRSVALKLASANFLLTDFDAELVVLDGYRPIGVQRGLWDHFSEVARLEKPWASEEELVASVLNHVSDPRRFDPDDPRTWPVHSTGGAVDVTLRSIRLKSPFDMVSGFDEMNVVATSDFFERQLENGEIPADFAPLRNRRLLHWAMKACGFPNFDQEYWHFDWGNQLHALTNDLDAAWYGYVELPG